MKILAYSVIDPITALADVVSGVKIQETVMYAKIGEHGLLEDYLSRKGFVFYEPQEIEVDDSFTQFSILIITPDHNKLDLQNGQIIIKYPLLEPSTN
jgi:hypothetical protein